MYKTVINTTKERGLTEYNQVWILTHTSEQLVESSGQTLEGLQQIKTTELKNLVRETSKKQSAWHSNKIQPYLGS